MRKINSLNWSPEENLKRTRAYAERVEETIVEIIEEVEETLSLGCSPRLKTLLEEILHSARDAQFSIDFIKSIEDLEVGTKVVMEVVIPETGEKKEEIINISNIEENKVTEWRNHLTKEVTEIVSLLSEIETLYEKREIKREDGTIRKVLIEFKSDDSKIRGRKKGTSNTKLPEGIQALVDVSEDPLNTIRIPTDLVDVQINTGMDLLQSASDKGKNWIQARQKEGKLLNGTLEGLTGGDAYFYIFLIALAQTLNEQSNKYKRGDYYSGLPKDQIEKATGVEIEEGESGKVITTYKGEERTSPYVAIIFKDFIKKTRGGQSYGSKDIKELDNYIQKLSGKEYMIDRGEYGGIIGLTLLNIVSSLYHPETADRYGYILKLSPQFSESVRKYRKMRADTIKLLGGGKQKDITMNLLNYLIYVMNTPQKGRKGGEFAVNKTKLLEKIGKGKTYETRKDFLEKDFRIAIQKMIDIKLLHPKKGFREEISPAREKVCVFLFNPDYLQGEENIEDQTPQE